jgi:hypothetical protein
LVGANNSKLESGEYEGHTWDGNPVGGDENYGKIESEQTPPTPPGGSLISGLINDALDKSSKIVGEMLGGQVGDVLGANIAKLGSSIAKKEFKNAVANIGDAIEQMVAGVTLDDIPQLKPTKTIEKISIDDT